MLKIITHYSNTRGRCIAVGEVVTVDDTGGGVTLNGGAELDAGGGTGGGGGGGGGGEHFTFSCC